MSGGEAFGSRTKRSLFSTPTPTPSSSSGFGFQTPQPKVQFTIPSSSPTGLGFQTPQPKVQFNTPSSSPTGLGFQTPQPKPQFTTPSSSPTVLGFQSPQPKPQLTPPSSSPTGLGFQSPQPEPQFTTRMTTRRANEAPAPFSAVDLDIRAIVDAYKDQPRNLKYAFKHLLFNVTEPQFRVKPAGVSVIMWAEAMGKLEGMESADRDRLWPQLVQGFKDLSQRIKIQDEVIVSDSERLRITQSNIKMLQKHFQADTLPWIQRMKKKEQILHLRLLRVMRIVEVLQGKGCCIPLTTGEAELAEKLATITQQLKGSGADLRTRLRKLLTVSRIQTNTMGFGCSVYLPGSTKIHEQSLANLQMVLQHQTEAIARLGSVLKRCIRDMEIMMAEGAGTTTKNGNSI